MSTAVESFADQVTGLMRGHLSFCSGFVDSDSTGWSAVCGTGVRNHGARTGADVYEG
ncbi:hypothetical protein GCM10023167_14920 [Brevibacterium pityocampae]|uniref:Uncharacterized protein n=1 Tax=Brevibacterium pityocampae TaxID=506594 RepID=A0ABP8JDV4_9MICO